MCSETMDKSITPQYSETPFTGTCSPEETRKLWRAMVVVHIVVIPILSGMMLDGGEFSRPLAFYGCCVGCYLVGRIAITGYQPLTVLQRFALMLMPIYGFLMFHGIWLWIRIRFFHE